MNPAKRLDIQNPGFEGKNLCRSSVQDFRKTAHQSMSGLFAKN
uniref:Uncharacterized protein n=1 Tax=Arundo donax TaxID=35708 RepID=A0A0A8Y0W4_ARUDO